MGATVIGPGLSLLGDSVACAPVTEGVEAVAIGLYDRKESSTSRLIEKRGWELKPWTFTCFIIGVSCTTTVALRKSVDLYRLKGKTGLPYVCVIGEC